jgi:Protein of unknown function DUF262
VTDETMQANGTDEAELEAAEVPDDQEDESDLQNLDSPETFEAVVSSTDWTTETVLKQIERGRLNLDPEFQRRDAWTRSRKSKYIESLITNVPVPQIVLAERKGERGSYIVLDGKQRLLALWQFAGMEEGDGDGFRLIGLELRSDLNGLRLKDLPTPDRDAFETQTIRTVVVSNWKTDDFLYLVFLRLNTGNVRLNPQELRQALHPGPFVRFTNDFTANSEAFHAMLRRKTPDFRMRDVELLVRYFAFDRFLPEHSGNLKPLLDLTCEALNEAWPREEGSIKGLATACERAIEVTLEVFGENAFRRWRDDRYERPYNRAVFDAMVFYAKDGEVTAGMLADPGAVEAAFRDACADPRFAESISTTTKSIEAIEYRLRVWGEALAAAIGKPLPIPVIDASGRIAYS